jgi:hypothetical protein
MAFQIAADASGAQHQIQDLLKCPIPKTTRKAPSGVRTCSPATNGIAAFEDGDRLRNSGSAANEQ